MPKIYQFLKNKFSRLGPGFITGAADNDPSGIATYSIAGAQFGYRLNWLCLFLTPMMVAIQEMCGRIGMCSGMGLAGVIKKFYSKKLLIFAVGLLLVANIINISADLGIMAACFKMIFKLPFLFWLICVTVFTIFMEIVIPYRKYSFFLRFLGLTLLVYAVTAFMVKQNWLSLIKYTLIPHLSLDTAYLMTLVAFVGTTISPYLFFWQASEEVEKEIIDGKITEFNHKPYVNRKQINFLHRDTIFGMIFSNLIAAFIILTAAGALHANGITNIETPQQAAMALRPLAGNFAFLIFTIGIISIGLQSIPILAGSVTYAVSEVFGFKEGLGKKLKQAKAFYFILSLAILIGALINIIGINPIRALYYTAIINGIISVPLIAIIIKIANDQRVVGNYKITKINRILAWMTFVFVGVASLLMIFNLFKSGFKIGG